MSWKCFFWHRWNLKNKRVQLIYENQQATRPTETWTLFLYECRNCHQFKVEKVEGQWIGDDDDKDDDDPPRDPMPTPPNSVKAMTPDDFYEMCSKD